MKNEKPFDERIRMSAAYLGLSRPQKIPERSDVGKIWGRHKYLRRPFVFHRYTKNIPHTPIASARTTDKAPRDNSRCLKGISRSNLAFFNSAHSRMQQSGPQCTRQTTSPLDKSVCGFGILLARTEPRREILRRYRDHRERCYIGERNLCSWPTPDATKQSTAMLFAFH